LKHKVDTLAIDIGGTFIKMMIIDLQGSPVSEFLRAPTPQPATVSAILTLINKMIQKLGISFDRVSAGFPGVVQNGIIKTAHNLDPSWLNFPLDAELECLTDKPTRVANDADIQGYGDISGKGVELVITLGTGVGSALFLNGQLVPNLELGHHPFEHNLTYEQLLGKKALIKFGITKWRAHLKLAIALWQRTFNYDRLFLGGGNAHKINFPLPPDVQLSDNIEGVLGGIKLWD
jgi:polyphosphate glucokinase